MLAVLALAGCLMGWKEGSAAGWAVMAAAIGYLIVSRRKIRNAAPPATEKKQPGSDRGRDGEDMDWEAFSLLLEEQEREKAAARAARAREKAERKRQKEAEKRAEEQAWQRAVEFFEGFDDD